MLAQAQLLAVRRRPCIAVAMAGGFGGWLLTSRHNTKNWYDLNLQTAEDNLSFEAAKSEADFLSIR